MAILQPLSIGFGIGAAYYLGGIEAHVGWAVLCSGITCGIAAAVPDRCARRRAIGGAS